jgi:hypothetical protein
MNLATIQIICYLNLSPVQGKYKTVTHGTTKFDVRQKLADLGTACLF